MFYIYEVAHTNIRFISCDGHQLYDFKERGVDLEVEVVRGGRALTGPASCKGQRSRTRGRSQCVFVKIWRNTWNTYLVWRLNVV